MEVDDICEVESSVVRHPTQKHYNQDIQLFSSFLDPYLKYSSGLWLHERDTLETAAINMLDKIIGFMPDLKNASILEVGPGWGSLIKRCVEKNHGCLPKEYVVINPSAKQNQYIKDNVHRDVTFYEDTFEQLDNPIFVNRFDVIVYLGSFAHMTNIREVMKKLNGYLRSNGRIIIEDTLYISQHHYENFNDHPETDFIQKDVFGIAPIPSLPDVIEWAGQSGLGIDYVLEHSDSYRKTLLEWIARLKQSLGVLPFWANKSIVENIRYMELVLRAWGFTVGNYLIVMKKNKIKPNFVRPQNLNH